MKQYGNITEEQKRWGIIEKVDDNNHAMNLHYIPHHPVKKESSTTLIWIVHDCSCKQTSDSPSLNDYLHSGPHPLMTSVPFSFNFGNIILPFQLILRRPFFMFT